MSGYPETAILTIYGGYHMNSNGDYEISATAQLLMVVATIGFSIALIIFNILLGWEKWPIPIMIAVAPACLVMHMLHKPDTELRTGIYAAVLFIQMFYFITNIDTVFDGVGMVVVTIMILTFTMKRYLVLLCYLVASIGMLMHLFMYTTETGISFSVSDVVRTVWAFLLVALAELVADRTIAQRKREKKRLEEKIEESEKINKSAGDFLANVSHEIRTPINAVIGLSGVCIDREDDADIRLDLSSIKDAGKRVATQISDILDYSEIDRHQLAVNKEDYMILSVLHDLVTEMRPYMKPDVEVVIDVDPEVPSMMRTDVSKLKKIIWHLLVNGLKYTKQGGVYVRISTKPQDYGVNLFIEVEDTGVGIDSENLSRVFDRFYQTDSGRSRSSSGLGLGLSIVSGFVSALGGFLTVESTRGVGTTIHVSLPQEVIDGSECMSLINPKELKIAGFLRFDKFPHPQVREYYNSVVRNIVSGLKVELFRVDNGESLRELVKQVDITHLFVGEVEYMENPDLIEEIAKKTVVNVVATERVRLPRKSRIHVMPKPFYCFPVATVLNAYWEKSDTEIGKMYCPGIRALVVDDEPMNLTVAMGLFRGYGMIVETAESGEESIRMCEQNRYDIVFMDHMMPGMDGVEAMKRLRILAGKQGIELPIVALTANAVSSAKEMFMREGFDGFVSKPVEITELERVLKRVLPRGAFVYEDEARSRYLKSETGSIEDDVLEFEPDEDESGDGDETEVNIEALSEYGIDISTGLGYCKDDKAFYVRLLRQFAKESGEKRQKMREAYDADDMKQYAVYVHAIKSTSKMIGVAELSERARKLEVSAKSGDTDSVKKHHDDMFSQYIEVVAGIKKVCGESEPLPGNTDDISGDDPAGSTDDEPDVLEFSPEGGEEV